MVEPLLAATFLSAIGVLGWESSLDLFSEKRILSVSQLTDLVRVLLEENFDHVWVEGELSNLSMPSSGHIYFTLKDAGAQLRCVMFRASARALRFKPADGVRLLVRGRISVYDQRGDYQLIVEYLEPQGIGGLQLAFIQLKERLAKEGLFSEGHKKPIPHLPQRIGVVTSATGAAVHDILTILNRRFANVQVLIRPVKVQGEGAAGEIATAIADFNRHRDVDVLIVGRGGGSMEDLWAFNEEVVARAIYNSKIPVISAVGHEVDFTIADFVADLRAPTPSAAAELVVRSKAELQAELDTLSHRLLLGVARKLNLLSETISGLKRVLKDPSFSLQHLAQRVDDLDGRILRAMASVLHHRAGKIDALQVNLRMLSPALRLERTWEKLIALNARLNHVQQRILAGYRESVTVNTSALQALSPLQTLSRGYSITRKLPELSVVLNSDQLAVGDHLDIRLHKGGIICKVAETR
jgi:exodeoxyribonuclease VII large subunit